jgi:hypothetical protein
MAITVLVMRFPRHRYMCLATTFTWSWRNDAMTISFVQTRSDADTQHGCARTLATIGAGFFTQYHGSW